MPYLDIRPVGLALACTPVILAAWATSVHAASLSRSVDVNGTPASVWQVIGPFCAIKDWHPAIGTCTETSTNPPTRTLVTKDGKATFVETQTARSDADHSYSYAIKTSPLPLTNYVSTIKVAAKDNNMSTVTWSSTYAPEQGKEKEADAALSGIYESGLDAIKAKFAK